MDLQCFPVNFCTDFPLKVKYSDFHKVYINIFEQNLDIYKTHPSVTDCRLYYVFDLSRFLRYVIRIINNPEWITIFISRKLPQYGPVRCLKLYS